MDSFTIPEAKERLEDLMRRAARGEDVCIVDPDLGTVRLAAILEGPQPETDAEFARRRVGRLKGQVEVPERLFEPMTDTDLADWYDGPKTP
jgi:antitoxin (DNA-binding transcriptional repressor) of toxin-antitoxin stability system